jgi:hypothetical protein
LLLFLYVKISFVAKMVLHGSGRLKFISVMDKRETEGNL